MADIVLELPSSITYVAGYVNDVVTVFRQDSWNAGRWYANVDVSEDSLYHIVLEMRDEAGNIGYYDDVIEYILPVFIYDRVQEDVDRANELYRIGWNNMTAEQKTEWTRGMKGCLNTSDLKRIENAVYVIAGLVHVNLQTNKDNLPEIPDSLYFQTLIENVTELRAAGYLYSDTPDVPEQPLNTYQKINDIEHILHDIYEVYNANNICFPYCGTEAYAGEEYGLL